MARIRTIKPDFWTDGAILDLSLEARLFFIGTWNFALCDKGHLPDDARKLKFQILPADDFAAELIIKQLLESGRLVRIAAGERTFLHIKRFEDHQKTDARWNSRCPACALQGAPDLPATHPNSREFAETQSRKGKERKGKESTSSEVADAPPDQEPLREDVRRLCSLLVDRIEANGSKRPNVTKAWRDAARLMLDSDGRTEDQVAWIINWCQRDEFWRAHVLSMPKLREKFDMIRLKAVPTSNVVQFNQPDEQGRILLPPLPGNEWSGR
jgi:hypothetical protein